VLLRPPYSRNELLRWLLLLLVLQRSAWRLTSVEATGVPMEEPRVEVIPMDVRASTGVSSPPTASALPASPPIVLSAVDPTQVSNIAIVDEAASGVMQGVAAEASSDEITSGGGSSLARLHGRQLEPPSSMTDFDFSSPSTLGWSTGGSGTCSFSDSTGSPSVGAGSSGYYYYAEASPHVTRGCATPSRTTVMSVRRLICTLQR
jgi:hypothetical protein